MESKCHHCRAGHKCRLEDETATCDHYECGSYVLAPLGGAIVERRSDACRISSLTSEVQRLRDSQVTPIRIRKAYNRALDRMVNYGVSMSVAAQNMLRVNLIEELVKDDHPNA